MNSVNIWGLDVFSAATLIKVCILFLKKFQSETKKKMTLKAELKTLLGPASSDFHCLQNIPGKGSPEYL